MRGRNLLSLGILCVFVVLLTSFKSKEKGPQEGDNAPEIVLPTPNGDLLKLSSLRGHLVLVHFWASWCRTCKEQSHTIDQIYSEFKDKQFTTGSGLIVLNVSLDNNKNAWLAGISKDGFTANYNVSDLKNTESIVMATYNIKYLPENYLIDGNGKIIAGGGAIIDNLQNFIEEELVQKSKRKYSFSHL